MAWETARTKDPDTCDRLVDAGWEVYHTVADPATQDPKEWRLRIDAQDMEQKARSALQKNQGSAPFEGVNFASDAARDLALDEGLRAEDFETFVPSGKTGYTKSDVEAAAREAGMAV